MNTRVFNIMNTQVFNIMNTQVFKLYFKYFVTYQISEFLYICCGTKYAGAVPGFQNWMGYIN